MEYSLEMGNRDPHHLLLKKYQLKQPILKTKNKVSIDFLCLETKVQKPDTAFVVNNHFSHIIQFIT